ncbi:DDE-type integrase/transposase/recombinase [Streptomyces olivoreticuli]
MRWASSSSAKCCGSIVSSRVGAPKPAYREGVPWTRIRDGAYLEGYSKPFPQVGDGFVLRREGVHVGRKRVERLMREADLAGVGPRRKSFTRRDPKATLAPDLVQRDFTAPAPNRLWVADLTMITTGEGPLWLSAIRDAFSRRVVAWETSARADADLVLSTLEYALASREVSPASSFTTPTTAVSAHRSSSQPTCYGQELRPPWGLSGTVMTTPSRRTCG